MGLLLAPLGNAAVSSVHDDRASRAPRAVTPNDGSRSEPRRSAFPAFRIILGVLGLVVLVALVRHVGAGPIAETLRGAIAWLPLLCLLELVRIACETAASYLAFGALAVRIPRATLLRAHVLGHSLGTVAPAPTVVSETIKATLVAPYVGVGAATSVGFINQAATLISVGLFSIPCGAAILVMGGASLWFWACLLHAIVLVGCGVGLQAVTRADGPGRWLVTKLPSLADRAAAFRDHASGVGLFALGPTSALLLGRGFQVLQLAIAARAVGIAAGPLSAMAAEGVNLLAAAVGVLVPGGLGTTDGAFTLAAGMLQTSEAKAMSLALLVRCTQLLWVLIASLMALLAPRRPT
jgi:Lysylphosphatidylglycerol synthase TM region